MSIFFFPLYISLKKDLYLKGFLFLFFSDFEEIFIDLK